MWPTKNKLKFKKKTILRHIGEFGEFDGVFQIFFFTRVQIKSKILQW